MNPTPSTPDPRDAHIAALESQCAALQSELIALKARIDPGMALIPPERSGAATAILEIHWKSAPEEFTPANSARAQIPQGGFVSTRYFEIPPTAQQIRIDPGNRPSLWFFAEITLHHLDPENALLQPPAAWWNADNSFAGLSALRAAIILPSFKLAHHTLCKILTWDSDPQLLITLPPNPDLRPAILTLSCASLDPSHAIMAQQGQHLLDRIANLQSQLPAPRPPI